jgi:predicted RNA polymerase sigma factor
VLPPGLALTALRSSRHLRKVPAEQRRALVLCHLLDLTVEQIAAETGAQPGTVKARLARGRAALAPYLEPYFCGKDASKLRLKNLTQSIFIVPGGIQDRLG